LQATAATTTLASVANNVAASTKAKPGTDQNEAIYNVAQVFAAANADTGSGLVHNANLQYIVSGLVNAISTGTTVLSGSASLRDAPAAMSVAVSAALSSTIGATVPADAVATIDTVVLAVVKLQSWDAADLLAATLFSDPALYAVGATGTVLTTGTTAAGALEAQIVSLFTATKGALALPDVAGTSTPILLSLLKSDLSAVLTYVYGPVGNDIYAGLNTTGAIIVDETPVTPL
jgi:hypothetical protein